jgi:hypothetical protein
MIIRTFGNNVQAYEDIRNLNRPFDDASYAITSAGTLKFDYPIDFKRPLITYQKLQLSIYSYGITTCMIFHMPMVLKTNGNLE